MSYADHYRSDDPDRRFLQSRVWREKIRPTQLRREPLCRFCMALGQINVAEQVDHITRPRGDHNLQHDPSNFQSLCAPHHGAKSKWERGNVTRPLRLGTSLDGWTITATGGTVKLEDAAAAQPMRGSSTINGNKKGFAAAERGRR